MTFEWWYRYWNWVADAETRLGGLVRICLLAWPLAFLAGMLVEWAL